MSTTDKLRLVTGLRKVEEVIYLINTVDACLRVFREKRFQLEGT